MSKSESERPTSTERATRHYSQDDAIECQNLSTKIEAHERLSEGDHLRVTVTWLTDDGTPEATFDADVVESVDDHVALAIPDDSQPPVTGDWHITNMGVCRVKGEDTLFAIKEMLVWPANRDD